MYTSIVQMSLTYMHQSLNNIENTILSQNYKDMNNKDFLNQLAGKASISVSEAKQLSDTFTNMFADYADDGTVFSIQGFGNFEVKKKMERVVVNPSTKQRMIVPPKLVLSFKPSTSVKDKFKK